MATVTKTYTDNLYSSATYRKTWTVNYVFADITASGSTFVFNTPTITAKFVGTGVYRHTELSLSNSKINGVSVGASGSNRYIWKTPNSSAYIKGASNTLFTMSKGGTSEYDGQTSYSHNAITLNTADFFKATNKTQRSLDVTFVFSYYTSLTTDTQSDGLGYYSIYRYDYNNTQQTYTLGTVTLNVPPTATLGTPTYATPHYAGLGAYTVPITYAEAYYGGDISKVTLTVGQDSVVQTYSSATISNQSISVTPSVAGTFTPTLTVEDSRGQTYTETLADIVVNPYLAPSLDFDVFRSDSSGVRDDEGAYGLATVNVTFTDAIADLVQPTVKINGTTTNNVTWYSAYNASTGVSSAISDWSTVSSGDTIYGLINGSFAQTDSYQITVILEDSLSGASSAITQTLSTAFYTIDFQAGGKEIAFGAPANDNLTGHPDGLFKCEMDALFNGDVTATGDTTLSTGDTEIENPYFSLDTTASPGTTDGDLYAAITALGWQSDVIE